LARGLSEQIAYLGPFLPSGPLDPIPIMQMPMCDGYLLIPSLVMLLSHCEEFLFLLLVVVIVMAEYTLLQLLFEFVDGFLPLYVFKHHLSQI
jgi:hypothetical protein